MASAHNSFKKYARATQRRQVRAAKMSVKKANRSAGKAFVRAAKAQGASTRGIRINSKGVNVKAMQALGRSKARAIDAAKGRPGSKRASATIKKGFAKKTSRLRKSPARRRTGGKIRRR